MDITDCEITRKIKDLMEEISEECNRTNTAYADMSLVKEIADEILELQHKLWTRGL